MVRVAETTARNLVARCLCNSLIVGITCEKVQNRCRITAPDEPLVSDGTDRLHTIVNALGRTLTGLDPEAVSASE